MSAVKKYKLHAASDGAPSVCAFFSSPDGCRNGENCKFLHVKAGADSANEISENASVVSSESEDEEVEVQVKVKTPVQKAKQPVQKVKQEPKVQDDDDPFAMGSPAKEEKKQPPAQKQQKNKRKSNPAESDDVFANPKKRTSLPGSNNTTTNTPPNKKQKQSPKQPAAVGKTTKAKEPTVAAPAAPDFRSLISNLPIASFSIPGVSTPAKKEARAPTPAAAPVDNGPPLPRSTQVGRKWQPFVIKTREHERYANNFDFDKYKQQDVDNGITAEWIKTKAYGSWCANNPQVIAIDCEMCETQDPLTGSKNHKALCRVSIVNGENPEEVLLDTLVKPAWPVTDYRSRINGIKKEHLESVEFTLRHAQAFVMALCSEETVIVGHAVQNDLASLNLEHHVVADSSFLFQAQDSTSASVSLKDLVKSIFSKDMPDTHDSVNDARKAFECVLHYVEKDGNVEPIERTPKNKGHQLFVHRIPKQCKPQHLTNMFLNHTGIQPTEVEDLEFSGDTGKAHVTFRSSRHAGLAFDTIEGTAEADKSGKLQKKVFLRNGSYVRVRKMVVNHHTNRNTPTKTPTNTPTK
jgi:RNA exonuclease 1